MSKAITTIPREESEPRVETGPIQFGNDWPGVFLRGDDAFAYASALEQALRPEHDFAAVSMMEGLARTLRGCVIGASSELLRSFAGAPTLTPEAMAEIRREWEKAVPNLCHGSKLCVIPKGVTWTKDPDSVLLEACKEALACLASVTPMNTEHLADPAVRLAVEGQGDYMDRVRKQLRDAIAKATGKKEPASS